MAKMYKLKRPALGIDQLSDETSLITVDNQWQTALRQATNVDIDNDGNINRRKGYEVKLAGTGYHSLYETQRGWLMLCYKQSIGIYDSVNNQLAALADMNEAYLTSYAELNGNIYFVNPGSRGMIFSDETVVRDIGVPLPASVPTFAAVASGSLPAGKYGVTYSIVNNRGEESPLGEIVEVELTEQGSIQGTLFTVVSGCKYRVYMTTADGEELYQAVEFDADVTSYLITDHEEGRQPDTQYLSQLPYGYIIRAHGSRLYVATNNFVFFSEPFLPHLTNEANDFLPTNGFTTMVQPVNEGLFIGDQDGVRFYKGDDPSSFVVSNVSTEIPIFGTSISLPGEHLSGDMGKSDIAAVWLAPSGYHVGMPSGEVVRLHSRQVSLPQYVQGCTAFSIKDGRKQLITPVNSNVLADASVALDSTIS